LSWRQAPWDSGPAILFQLNTCFHSPCVISSLARGWVCSLKFVAGPRQRSNSQVRLRQDSWPHFTVSNSRLPQSGINCCYGAYSPSETLGRTLLKSPFPTIFPTFVTAVA
jgi:hypothetical protein